MSSIRSADASAYASLMNHLMMTVGTRAEPPKLESQLDVDHLLRASPDAFSSDEKELLRAWVFSGTYPHALPPARTSGETAPLPVVRQGGDAFEAAAPAKVLRFTIPESFFERFEKPQPTAADFTWSSDPKVNADRRKRNGGAWL